MYVWMVKPPSPVLVSIEIDKLTNSIEQVTTGAAFETNVSLVSPADLKTIIKANGWLFNWRNEVKYPARQVFKLTLMDEPNQLQGLISIEIKADHVFMHLIESAPFNLGKNKIYVGVPGNLVAHACRLSFEHGHDGYLSFVSKTKLFDHYATTLGATRAGGQTMIINTAAALVLTRKYFN